jgi:hypothetical protein
VSSRQESLSVGLHQQDQNGGEESLMVSFWDSKHQLKIHKGDDEESAWKHKKFEGCEAVSKMEKS